MEKLYLENIPLGRYRHYKGNEYEVIAIARHSETLEPMVVYKALYGDNCIWVRPASMWFDTISEGITRFMYLEKQKETV